MEDSPLAGSAPFELPMFPLGTPILPLSVLPLRIFEPRYQALADECLGGPVELPFGIVQIERGSEVGGGDTRAKVGCQVTVVAHKRLDDGQLLLAVAGKQRINVTEWLADDPFPRALVTAWPDEEQTLEPELQRQIVEQMRDVRSLAISAGKLTESPDVDDAIAELEAAIAETETQPTEFSDWSFRACAIGPTGAYDRQRLLCAEGPASRLKLLAEVLQDTTLLLKAELNG